MAWFGGGWNNQNVRFASKPSTLCVDGMENVDFCTIEALEKEIGRENDIVKEYQEAIDVEVATYSDGAEKRFNEFKNLVTQNIEIIKTKLKERVELRKTENDKMKYHIPDVKYSKKETVLTPIVYTADVFEIVFKFLSLEDLLLNISLTCWMFRIFVMKRVEIYVDVNLSTLKQYPLDSIINTFKIGGIKIRTHRRMNYYYGGNDCCDQKDLQRITKMIENTKDTLKRLILKFEIRAQYHHYGAFGNQNQEKPKIDEIYENFENKIGECKKLVDIALPYFPSSKLSSLRTLSFNLLSTFEKNRHKEMVQFFEDSNNTRNLEKIDISHNRRRRWWGGFQRDIVSEDEKAKVHVELFNGISKCKKLKVFKTCVLKNFDYSQDFIDSLTKLEIVKVKYCDYYVSGFYDDFSSALIQMQEAGLPLKIRVIRAFLIDELMNHFENFFAIGGIKLIINSDVTHADKRLGKFKTKYQERPKMIVWKENKITMKNIEAVCKMVCRLGVQKLEIGRVVVNPFRHIQRVFKHLEGHEEGVLGVNVSLVKGLFQQIGSKQKLLDVLKNVVESEDFSHLESIQIRSVKIKMVQSGKVHARYNFPKIGTVQGQKDYTDEEAVEFAECVESNNVLKRLDCNFGGGELQARIEEIMDSRAATGNEDDTTSKVSKRGRRKRRRRK